MRRTSQSTAPHKRNIRWVTAWICLGLVILTLAVFIQTVRFDFVNYDDPSYVYQNTRILSGINVVNVAWAFTHVHSENWHPLTTITHMLDCQLHGLNAGWHHFTNVLLHSIAVVLLFVALQRMTGALWRSAFVSAVFAVHPLHVESVAWIAERKDVLSAVFFMVTLLAYLNYTRAPSIGRYLTVALAVVLGLMSKPMLVTLPFVLLLLDYWPLGRFEAHRSNTGRQVLQLVLEKIPLIALSTVSSIVTFLAQQGAIGWTEQLPVSERISNAIVAYVVYIRQMFWPAGLAVFYPHPENRLPIWEISLALIVLGGITAAAFVLRKKAPYLVTGWFWYLGMLVPVIGLLQVGWQGHADRYTYLPQIGLYVALTWAVTDLTRSWRFQRMAFCAAALLIVGALSCRAWLQTSYWRDSETLFTHTLAVTSNNDVALNNLGIISLDKGQLDDAISKLQAAIELRPENAPAHDNLAKALLKKGQVAEAMVHYRKFLELEPASVEARNTLGTALIQQGHVREAIEQWQEALATQPENGNAASNLAWVFATCPEDSIRDGARAIELGEKALRISGGKIAMIYRVLAAAYAESGRFADAVETANRGVELATIQGSPALAAELEKNVTLYQSGTPLRDSSIKNGNSSP
ncbi:MAG: tetratricopeptide repeat protein [Candidatus Udaeobacter sp.]